MQIRQLRFELLVIHRGARDVARPARASASGINCLVHGVQDNRMLAHPQIIVATPHCNVLLAAVGAGPDRMGELAVLALDIDERPIAAFRMQLFNRKVEFRGIVHRHLHGIVWHQRIWRVLWSGSLYSQ